MDLLVNTAPETVPANVACAVAVALCLGVPPATVAARLESLPGAPHRRSIGKAASGATIIDDTFNSNPTGAMAALKLLAGSGEDGGKKVVVTPGMVELGPLQDRENANFGAEAGSVADELFVVGRTNSKALSSGARAAGRVPRRVRHRRDAVAWVVANLGPADAVLYENDLPDHYP
jgi:UDP-N-acetylmuramoyl-tripeptide--D-alanyl-D-alanine ligase